MGLNGKGINTQFKIPSPECLIPHKSFPFLLQVKFYTLQGLNFTQCSKLIFLQVHIGCAVSAHPTGLSARRLRSIDTDMCKQLGRVV